MICSKLSNLSAHVSGVTVLITLPGPPESGNPVIGEMVTAGPIAPGRFRLRAARGPFAMVRRYDARPKEMGRGSHVIDSD